MATNNAVLVLVAQGITDQIAGATFNGIKLKPERSYADWKEELECEDNKLLCDVVPVIHRESQLDTRGSVGYLCDVDVGLRSRPPNLRQGNGRVDVRKVDRLVQLVEAIHEYFCDAGKGRRLDSFQEAVWVETRIRQTFVRKHLMELGQFTSIIRLSYDVNKERQ